MSNDDANNCDKFYCIMNDCSASKLSDVEALSLALLCAKRMKCYKHVHCSDLALEHIHKIVDAERNSNFEIKQQICTSNSCGGENEAE
jgi:hypothetical protein